MLKYDENFSFLFINLLINMHTTSFDPKLQNKHSLIKLYRVYKLENIRDVAAFFFLRADYLPVLPVQESENTSDWMASLETLSRLGILELRDREKEEVSFLSVNEDSVVWNISNGIRQSQYQNNNQFKAIINNLPDKIKSVDFTYF